MNNKISSVEFDPQTSFSIFPFRKRPLHFYSYSNKNHCSNLLSLLKSNSSLSLVGSILNIYIQKLNTSFISMVPPLSKGPFFSHLDYSNNLLIGPPACLCPNKTYFPCQNDLFQNLRPTTVFLLHKTLYIRSSKFQVSQSSSLNSFLHFPCSLLWPLRSPSCFFSMNMPENPCFGTSALAVVSAQNSLPLDIFMAHFLFKYHTLRDACPDHPP